MAFYQDRSHDGALLPVDFLTVMSPAGSCMWQCRMQGLQQELQQHQQH